MSKVLSHMTMSLDGYIADPGDQPGELFDWYQADRYPLRAATRTSISMSTRRARSCWQS